MPLVFFLTPIKLNVNLTIKAKLFNMYFHSVFTCSSFNLPNMKDFPSHSNPITTIQFSVTEVYKALISLHPKKTAGVDDIGPKILQSAASALAHPLHHAFVLHKCNQP